MTNNLKVLLRRQREYNNKIRGLNPSKSEWTQTYLLGMITEVDEILREIDWKKHRKARMENPNVVNIALELADLTKYTLSLWELWGFDYESILYYVDLKSRSLELKTQQENEEIPDDRPIVITDIDGTVGDWRTHFLKWLESKGIKHVVEDQSTSLMIDNDLSMLYKEYYDLKEEFESTGQYRNIEVYEDAHELLVELKSRYNAYIIAVTARPSDHYSRIWMDTWMWLESNKLPVDKLIIGSESRILLAHSLQESSHEVIMLEDNPGLIQRGANSGIRTFAREHPYNRGIQSRGVTIVKSYKDIPISRYFPNLSKEE